MTSAETLSFLQDFHRELLDLVLKRQVNARSVAAYDANNAYQQVLGRQDVHLQWLSDAIAAVGGSVGDVPSGEVSDPAEKNQTKAFIERDLQAQREFVARWEPRVSTVTNARHHKMLQLIVGEMKEHMRAFQQAAAGRMDVLGRHADGKELSGSVMAARPRN